MGQPVTVIEKITAQPGVVRYETNRNLTGTGHEYFDAPPHAVGERAVDELARRLFATGKVRSVHVYLNMITVQLTGDARSAGLGPVIEDLYLYYREGVPVPSPDDFAEPEPADA